MFVSPWLLAAAIGLLSLIIVIFAANNIKRERSMLSEGLFRKTATEQEWALADMQTDSVMSFFRYWTAKEAVLKATGIGIKDLLKCRVQHIFDDHHLQIQYDGQDWLIEHFFFKDHVASIVKGSFQIEWKLERLSG